MLFDLHAHTDISPCGSLTIGEILANAKRLGLGGVCITDHDAMEAARYVREGAQADGLIVIIGMEYATADGDFLLFGPYEGLQSGLAARDVLALVGETGGAAVAAHPFRRNRPVSEFVMRSRLCRIMELVNGRNSFEDNARAEAWRGGYGPHLTGGSDAHTLAELGRVATRFSVPITSRADLVAALNAGLCRPEVLRAENIFRPGPEAAFSMAASL